VEAPKQLNSAKHPRLSGQENPLAKLIMPSSQVVEARRVVAKELEKSGEGAEQLHNLRRSVHLTRNFMLVLFSDAYFIN
jgi:hypothetical protein